MSWKRSLFVWEKENDSFKITVIILSYIRTGNLQFKKDFEIAELYTKTSIFLNLKTDLKMAKETNKGEVESKCARVSKPASKKMVNAEVDLNWLWTIDKGLFWLYNIHEEFSLFHTNANWFHDSFIFCSTCSKSMESMEPNGNISMEWAKILPL